METTIRPSDPELAAQIRHLVDGFQVSQAISVAATLGIADLLANQSRTSDELAESTGTHPPTLYRLLRALASVDLLRELDGRRFELTPLGEYLQSNVPDSIAGWAAFIGRPYIWQAWAGLLHSVQTGENAFHHVYHTDVWTYRSNHPDENIIFNRAMESTSRRATAALLAAYNFGVFHTIVDVGGGTGALLATILAMYPRLDGVLFDQPHVIAGALELLERAGVSDRCRIQAGSFFETVPNGGDAYMLRNVIHDWEDADSIRILGAVRRAIPPDGTLLLIERMIEPPNKGRDGKFIDLVMLVGAGGRERTREEIAALFDAAGFRLTRVVNAGEYSVVEASPA